MKHTTNIVIPMAGLGTRFQQRGYTLPKPLIDVNGEPMILKATRTLGVEGQYHFVIRKDEFSDKIKDTVLSAHPQSVFLEIDKVTEGPACSVLLLEKYINNNHELIVTNCDQVMWWNPKPFLMVARDSETDGTIVTYHSTTTKNSYAKLDRNGFVTEVKEKEVISHVSLNGIHYWKKGSMFVDSAKAMINANDRAPNGEFYVGPTYNYMIKSGLKVGIYHIPIEQHHAIGVPDELNKYINLENGQS